MGFCVYYIYHSHNKDSASRLKKKCHHLSEMQQRRQMVRSNSHHWWCPIYVRSLTPRRVQLSLLYSCKVKSRHAIAHKRVKNRSRKSATVLNIIWNYLIWQKALKKCLCCTIILEETTKDIKNVYIGFFCCYIKSPLSLPSTWKFGFLK